jgi:SAM-dependent methyltransferase
VADLPVELSDGLDERLFRSLDVEGKIPRALEALGPVRGRDVLVLDHKDGLRARQLRDLGARVSLTGSATSGFGVPNDSADVVVSFWSSFQGASPAELAEAERALRPGGRLLVVHDYGRDDVSHLRADRPDYSAWSRPRGPFLGAGFKVRVVHCFWTFDSMEDCGDFLSLAFAEAGRAVAAGLKRPRLSYNVAIYHRSFGSAKASSAAPLSATVSAAQPVVPAGSVGPSESTGCIARRALGARPRRTDRSVRVGASRPAR